MKNMLYAESFNGAEASPYAKQNGYLDYGTLSRNFNIVLNNTIHGKFYDEFELVNGNDYYEDENGEITDPIDIYQEYIIDDRDAEQLMELTDEIVYYNDELDMYLWAITHFGTSWDYVLTNVKLNCGEKAFN